MVRPTVPPGCSSAGCAPPADVGPVPTLAAADSVSAEQRHRITELLEAPEADLLDRLGREIAPLETAAPALWLVSSHERFLPLPLRLAVRIVCRHLGPEAYRAIARRFLRANRSLFRLRICVGWNYCARRHSPEVLDRPRLVATLASCISHLIVGARVSPELVAALLVKQDLDKLCRWQKARPEGGLS